MKFQGQTVIVTGASRGIGKEIALQFAQEGATVACIATSATNAEPTVSAITEAGGKAQAYGLDISDSAAVKSVFEAIESDHGAPSVLVNNAGVTKDTLLMRMSDEDWDKVVSVNLKGAFLCTRAVIRSMMKARYGRIVNLTSVIGLHGQAGQANYSASKAGLLGLTMSTAKELGSRGVTCNAVAPGFIETDMTHDLPEEFRKKVVTDCPVGRLGTPADIAAAVLFLASQEAAFITGQCLTVDGGLML